MSFLRNLKSNILVFLLVLGSVLAANTRDVQNIWQNTSFSDFVEGSLTDGGANTAIGYQAGLAVDGGGSNVFIGYKAGDRIADTDSNTVIGSGAFGQSTNEHFCPKNRRKSLAHHACQMKNVW